MYDRTFFDAGIDRLNTDCEKWDDAPVCPPGAIPLWVADMDFACAKPISDAIKKRAVHPCYGYTMAGDKDAQAMCNFVSRRHGETLLPSQAAMLPCVVTGLKLFVQAFSQKGDRVAMFTPVYGPFFGAVRDNGREIASCPLKKGGDARYTMDFEALEALLKSGVRAVMACSPHNPVSRAWTREELETLLALIRAYDAVLAVDEIHADFVFAPHVFVPILSLARDSDKVVTFISASKTFNVAGLQQAMMVSKNAAMLKALKDAQQACGATCGNIFALEATRAAYTMCDDWLDGLMDYLNANKDFLAQEVARLLPKAVLTPIEATYLAWLDLSAYAPTCEELKARLDRHGVALTGGTFFGEMGQGHMRVNFGCPRAQLETGLQRLADAMNEA